MAGLLHERPGKVLTGPSQKKKHKINLANKKTHAYQSEYTVSCVYADAPLIELFEFSSSPAEYWSL